MSASRNFREVSLHSKQSGGTVITFTIGSTTTIKDGDYSKPHAGGGYAYRESGNVDSFTRNRLIVWFVSSYPILFLLNLAFNLIVLENSLIILCLIFLTEYQSPGLTWNSKLFKTRQHCILIPTRACLWS